MAKKSSPLTEADRYSLSRMPEGWFDPYYLPPVVRCPLFRCERLTKKGVLEWKIIGVRRAWQKQSCGAA